jgi:hypothetical protein
MLSCSPSCKAKTALAAIMLLSALGLSLSMPARAADEAGKDSRISCADGCSAPLPFGISANFMYISERLKIIDHSLSVNGMPIPSELVQFDSLVHRTLTESGRLDFQPFPFLDLYGLAGHVTGTAKKFKLSLSPMLPFQGLIEPGFTADYRGSVYGGGGTAQAGYGPIFLSYDINYTWTNLDVLDSWVRTLIQSARIHYCFMPTDGLRMSLYGGAMYARVLAHQMGTIDLNGNQVEFSIKARQAYAWNGLAGMQVELMPHWDLTMEGGLPGRRQFLVSLGFRF